MDRFIPTPAGDGWASIAEALAGKKWPEAAAVTDLRWHVDQHAKALWRRGIEKPTHEQLVEGIPGRPTLIKRWGWTDYAVRTLLAAPALWWDDYSWGPQVSPAVRQGFASEPPAGRQPQDGPTPKVEDIPPAGRQSAANGSPAELHTRGGSQLQPQLQPQENNTRTAPAGAASVGFALEEEATELHLTRGPVPVAPPAAPALVVVASKQRSADFQEALNVWNIEVVEAIRQRGGTASAHPRLDQNTGLGKPLRQRLDQAGLPAVLEVLRWVGTADHPRAHYLREKGYGLKTILRPGNFEEYQGFAQSPPPSTSKAVGKHAHDPPPLPEPPPIDRAEVERLRAEMQATRAAQEAEKQARLNKYKRVS